jgi:hypothetical protein
MAQSRRAKTLYNRAELEELVARVVDDLERDSPDMTNREILLQRLWRAFSWAVRLLDRWLCDRVVGYREQEASDPYDHEDDLKSIINQLASAFVNGECRCGRQNCLTAHHPRGLATWLKEGKSVTHFVYRAVVGPDTKGKKKDEIRTNSVVQSMMFLILHDEKGVRAGEVEFKECAACGGHYEGASCPNQVPTGSSDSATMKICGVPFAPDTTRVIARLRLVIEGVYVPRKRWACGSEEDPHYYPQVRCRTVSTPYFAAEKTRGANRNRVKSAACATPLPTADPEVTASAGQEASITVEAPPTGRSKATTKRPQEYTERVVCGEPHDSCPWNGCGRVQRSHRVESRRRRRDGSPIMLTTRAVTLWIRYGFERVDEVMEHEHECRPEDS